MPDPHRDESKSAAPRYSPGPVQSDEILLRTILDPHHFEDGILKAAAISLPDLEFKGWSVDRKRFTSLRRIKIFHEDRKRRNSKIKECYVIPVRADVIRFDTNGIREFVVTDTAEYMKPHHATVLLLTPSMADSRKRQFRDKLLQRLPNPVRAETVFEPKDKFGYLWGMFRQSISLILHRWR